MPGDLVHLLTTSAVERTHERALAKVERKTELANAEVFGVTQANTNALGGLSIVCMTAESAAAASPSFAPLFASLATGAAADLRQAVHKIVGRL